MIDTHIHLLDEALNQDREAILEHAQKAGVTKMVNICTTWDELLNIHLLPSYVFHAAAITPHQAHLHQDDYQNAIEDAVMRNQLIAIGETGFEFLHHPETEAKQIEMVKWHAHLAKKHSLPLIIHCRLGFDLLFKTLDSCFQGGKVLLHCFTGDEKEALQAIERGWLISISGIITFPKSESLRALVKKLPLESLVLETDAPWLSPVPYRGLRNEPAFLIKTAEMVAQLHQIDLAALIQKTSENACRFFNFPV